MFCIILKKCFCLNLLRIKPVIISVPGSVTVLFNLLSRKLTTLPTTKSPIWWLYKTYLQLLMDIFSYKETENQVQVENIWCWETNQEKNCSVFEEPGSFFGYLVCCVGPENSSWTRIRPLLEQRTRRSRVRASLCLVVFGQTAGPGPPAETEEFFVFRPLDVCRGRKWSRWEHAFQTEVKAGSSENLKYNLSDHLRCSRHCIQRQIRSRFFFS